ncbi:MAG TPA: PstS family phosphate ABC transporter substrate-binding protein [Nitrospira sp.]|nr:PstS family phosphate ABC transporter substrate-binding protein [Nitrospira sp.]
MRRIQRPGSVVACLGLAGMLVWWAAPTLSQPTALVKVDGSSTVFPITEAVAEEFQKTVRGAVRVTVGISGTGGGFKKFCRGETDLQDASRPIQSGEMEACRANGVSYIELPVAFDALTIAVSPQATWVDHLTLDELKRMWEPSAQGRVMKWSHIRPTWPEVPLKLFGAGADSGTFDYFTEAVVGKAKASRGDYTASEDDNTLVQGISHDKQALGYIPYAYFEPNQQRLKAVAVDGGKGPVLPSRVTVENGTYQPLSRPLFIYINAKAAERPEVKRFVEFYLAQTATLAPQVKYVPLPPQAYELALTHFRNGKVGTAFQGASMIGIKIEELLRREATL